VSIDVAAAAAYNTFPWDMIDTPNGQYSLPVVMLAIAGAESAWDNNSAGDWGYGGSTCDGSTSWGLWQIHNVHSDYLINVTASDNPCDWQQWLSIPENNAISALALYQGPIGLNNWTTYKNNSYLNYLEQSQEAINALQNNNGGTPITPVLSNPPSLFFVAAGLGLIAAGLAYMFRGGSRNATASFAQRKGYKFNPKHLSFTKPSDESGPPTPLLSTCEVYANVKSALAKRGVPVVENRNLSPGVEAQFVPELNTVINSVAISQQAEDCGPYATQVLLHEGTHALLQNKSCMPKFRNHVYASLGHVVEEEEAELSSFIAALELGMPIELYDGRIIPPGFLRVELERVKKQLDPDTFANVNWASNWLVRAGRGSAGLETESCPMMSKSR
jgi:hypothetical protein